jgi:dienelactone hydrolase
MEHGSRVRRLTATKLVAAIAAILLIPQAATRAAEPDALPQVVDVAQTYNDSPFAYRIESRRQEAGYSVWRFTYASPVITEIPQNNVVPAEYYLPDGIEPGAPKRPAVICMHILDGDFVLARLTCSMLASHGIPAMMIKLPYYDERGLPDGPEALAADPALFVGALSQGLEDVRRAVDLLASRPEVDPQRIGITGISLGGIVAATTGGIEPRFHRVMLVLAGGDLNRIIHHAEETESLSQLIKQLPSEQRARLEKAIDAVDPLRHAPGLRQRARQGRVLMVNAAEDEVIPPECTKKLAAELGISDRVKWLDGLGHYTTMAELPQVLATAVDFFGRDLPPGVEMPRPAPPSRTPLEVAATLIRELFTFAAFDPEPGHCHFVDFALSATPDGGDRFEMRARFIRGHQGQFKLDCDLPSVGTAAMGQNGYPWMVSAKNVLFKGTGGTGDGPGDPLAFADAENVLALQMAAGAAAGLSIAPHVLTQWIRVLDDTAPQGPPAIRVTAKEDNVGSLRVVLKEDKRTPQSATFDVAGVRGAVIFRGWQLNTVAHDAIFDPPAGLPEKEVDRQDLYRMFSAMFNFAVESAQ